MSFARDLRDQKERCVSILDPEFVLIRSGLRTDIQIRIWESRNE